MRTRLINLRKEKRFTQRDVAVYLKISPSHYRRKEIGRTRIYDSEWEQIAKLFAVSVEDIKDNGFDKDGNQHIDTNNHYCNMPEYILENQQKYIVSLETKINELQAEIEQLKKK